MTSFAVFDVDNTVLGFKSLFEFARFYCEQTQCQRFSDFQVGLQDVANKQGREVANRHFFTLFEGAEESQLQYLVLRWCEPYWDAGWPLVSSTLDRLHHHQQNSEKIIWLSGSAALFLKPIADAMNIDHVVASELEVINGICTGHTTGLPVIGAGKVSRLKSLLDRQQLNPKQGMGYGDHRSDLGFLEYLGNAAVVAGDPLLEKSATDNGWEILPPDYKNYQLTPQG